jgi:hypothetical protein
MDLPVLAFIRFIAAIIILSLVGLTTAWAFDAHATDSAAHGQQIDAADSANHPDSDDHAYNHCCHFGAHLAGLSDTPRQLSPVLQSALLLPTPVSLFLGRTIAPPLKPPQS